MKVKYGLVTVHSVAKTTAIYKICIEEEFKNSDKVRISYINILAGDHIRDKRIICKLDDIEGITEKTLTKWQTFLYRYFGSRNF
jgi:hypothetical protein